jgi:hypothetical protein
MRRRYCLHLPSIKPIGSAEVGRSRLEAALKRNDEKPITFRDFYIRHQFTRAQIIYVLKSHPDFFGLAKVRRHRNGGIPTFAVYLKSSPPHGMTRATVPVENKF